MNAKLDGVKRVNIDQFSSPGLGSLTSEVEKTPAHELIRWTKTAHEQSGASRRERIAVAAYYLSEARGFEPGHDSEDWLRAQADVDAIDAGTFQG